MNGSSHENERVGAAELYRDHARRVAGFLIHVGAPRDDVEDLVQEVFLVAHKRGGFEPGRAQATTWLFAIASRVWSNRRRTARRRPTEPLDAAELGAASEQPDPERALETRRALSRLDAALGALDEDHRAVFVMYEVEGIACAEIAAALEVPAGTVYRRLHTARERVRAAYDAEERRRHVG